MRSGTAIGRDALAALAAITFAGCGGGGSQSVSSTGAVVGATSPSASPSPTAAPTPAPTPAPAPPPSPSAEGVYIGSSSNGRTIIGIVEDNGSYWFLYSAINNSTVIAGGVQGTGTSTLGSFSSSNARDFSLEGSGINDATVSVSYVARQSLNGVITYTNLPSNISFNASYQPAYSLTPTYATIAGTYTGTAAVAGSVEAVTATISATGGITGSGASGCTFSGTFAPHATGNIYDVSVTFNGSVCSNGTSTVTGVAYFDAGNRRLYSAAVNANRSNGFIFTGTKP